MSTIEIALVTLGIMLVCGMPIFMTLIMAAAAALYFGASGLPLSLVLNGLFEGINIFTLLAIPCFVVAGALMEYGNITSQIIMVAKMICGRAYGGLGITTILACTFFAAISGSGPGTVAAVGTLMIPAMIKNGYSREYAAAAASSGGTIGIMIPPSNPMIIYAILGNLSVTAMFTAGFIPGFFVAACMMSTAYLIARRKGFKGDADTPPFEIGNFCKTCWKSFFSLMTPVIILGSIYSGYATPVEASVVAIMYALFVGFVINRSLRIKHLHAALIEGVMTCGTVIVIVGASTLFGKILTYEQAPLMLANMIFKFTHDPTVVLLMIICLLYVLGMFMETLSTLIILVPVLLPVIIQLGIDPIHFGVILVLTNETALLTPPLGVNIFVSSRIAGISVERNAMAVLPYVATLTFCALTIAFFPAMATWLPRVLGYGV